MLKVEHKRLPSPPAPGLVVEADAIWLQQNQIIAQMPMVTHLPHTWQTYFIPWSHPGH